LQLFTAKLNCIYDVLRKRGEEVLVSKDSGSWPGFEGGSDVPVYPADLTQALQSELAALAAIDVDYGQTQRCLESLTCPHITKERLVQQVDACHKRDREPHVLRLAALHDRIMMLTMFRGLRKKH